MLSRYLIAVAAIPLVLTACIAPTVQKPLPQMTQPASSKSAETNRLTSEILHDYAEAWRGNEEFQLKKPTVLGFWIDEEAFSIRLDEAGGTLTAGAPTTFDLGFVTDKETLQKLDAGVMNALTAMGQARADDPIPLRPKLPEDFSGGAEMKSYYIPLMLHFWNREWPETVPFGDGATRFVHGANTSVLVYEEGLRSAWYQLKPGMHINVDPKDQVNNFDTAIIVTRGSFWGKLNGSLREFREGETVLIPEGMTHEFFAGDEGYGEFIILMWGEKA